MRKRETLGERKSDRKREHGKKGERNVDKGRKRKRMIKRHGEGEKEESLDEIT